ncbi:MAG: YihA family ribosome biogenesis GTP-binding protein [Candidatus Lambdaproteobacteria bacterium]|nr:YihA family ribosome biogenesis GTP-binding protein [Candidatus Lambdaproteobacteria bacterium]
MNIRSAEFVEGAASPRQFPPPSLPEVAFVGKSNVGKSSLINALLQRKSLVKTSATPGKTRQINFFLVNGSFRFVDLPGYGYAKVPESVRRQWDRLMNAYLRQRTGLQGVVLIVDCRHAPSSLDVEMKAWLEGAGLPIVVAVNKIDKLKKAEQSRQVARLGATFCPGVPPVAFSARTGAGRDALWARLDAWLRAPLRQPDGVAP